MSDRRRPQSLNEAFAQLCEILPPGVTAELGEVDRSALFMYHFDLVVYIRHNWIQGRGSPLAEKMADLGLLTGPGSLAEVVCEAFWLHLRGQLTEEDQLAALLRRHGLRWASGQPAPEALAALLGIVRPSPLPQDKS